MKIKTKTVYRAIALFALTSVALLPKVHAVNPPPDGGYPGGNTAEGQNALFSLTTGGFNTAVGYLSLRSDATGSLNTAVGAGTLLAKTADGNTATGAGALLSNSTGAFNTASGAFALLSNIVGRDNTANGSGALQFNTAGNQNTAIGENALLSNTTGGNNTAVGFQALFRNNADGSTAVGQNAMLSNTTGPGNTAVGYHALSDNATNGGSTATGYQALENSTGPGNTGVGYQALNSVTTGSLNTALGASAGSMNTTGSANTYIGAGVIGVNGETNTVRIADNAPTVAGQAKCFIGGIAAQTLANGNAVFVDPTNHQLGVAVSSERFKKDIAPMNKGSEAIFSLTPVTFHYKSDQTSTPQFGLVAEEVARVSRALITIDKEGKPFGVRYEQINAMLLNEFLKEHKKVEEQRAAIEKLTNDLQKMVAQQQEENRILRAELREQASQLERISNNVDLKRPIQQVVLSEE